jgi:hypothetical protein
MGRGGGVLNTQEFVAVVVASSRSRGATGGARSKEGPMTSRVLAIEAANSSNIGSSMMSRTCATPEHSVSVSGSGWAIPVPLDRSIPGVKTVDACALPVNQP